LEARCLKPDYHVIRVLRVQSMQVCFCYEGGKRCRDSEVCGSGTRKAVEDCEQGHADNVVKAAFLPARVVTTDAPTEARQARRLSRTRTQVREAVLTQSRQGQEVGLWQAGKPRNNACKLGSKLSNHQEIGSFEEQAA